VGEQKTVLWGGGGKTRKGGYANLMERSERIRGGGMGKVLSSPEKDQRNLLSLKVLKNAARQDSTETGDVYSEWRGKAASH